MGLLRKVNDLLKRLPDKTYIKIYTFQRSKKWINLRKPRTLTEKLQYLKLYDRRKILPIISDKILVKKYAKKRTHKELYTPETLFVCNDPEQLRGFDFPQQFVIKTNFGSGDVQVVSNIEEFDIDKTVELFAGYIQKDYYFKYKEWNYKDIDKKIFVEEFLKDDVCDTPADYKFWMFNGKMELLMIIQDRFSEFKRIFLDKEYQDIGVDLKLQHPSFKKEDFDIPFNIDDMKEIAEDLSSEFDFVRVDFYTINDKIYLGELTLYPFSGVIQQVPKTDMNWDEILGDKLILTIRK